MRTAATRLAVSIFLLGSHPAWAGQDGGASSDSAIPGAAGFDAEQVKAAVARHIDMKRSDGGGVYRLTDDLTGERLELELVEIGIVGVEALWRIHDAARRTDGAGYFACSLFHPIGAPGEKLYDIDFWVSRRDGKLEVTEARIHKEPRLVGGRWTRVGRYVRTQLTQ